MIPSITVEFVERARTAVSRSKKGILCVVLPETTAINPVILTSDAQVDSTTFTNLNKKALHYAFVGEHKPRKVIAVGLPSSADITAIATALDKCYFDWVVSGHASFNDKIVEYVERFNGYSALYASTYKNSRKINAVVYKDVTWTGIDNRTKDHVVVFSEQDVYVDGTKVTNVQYLPRLAAVICAAPITESATYVALPEVTKIGVPTTVSGNVVYLTQDDDLIRVSTCLMVSGTKTAIQAAKDMIEEDIAIVFKNKYLGKVRNTHNNQLNLCASILGYLNELAKDGVVNPDSEITVNIDVDKMREVWGDAGVDVSDLTDAEVACKIIGSYVYVRIILSVLDCMEDMVVEITLE